MENQKRWTYALERIGMNVSLSKTEYMCANETHVHEFKYLGSTVQSNGECGKVVKKRVQAGCSGWGKVSGVICDQRVAAKVKRKLYKRVVRPSMSFGLETGPLPKRQSGGGRVPDVEILFGSDRDGKD